MTQGLNLTFVAIVLAWGAYAFSGLFSADLAALWIAGITALATLLARRSRFVLGFTALTEPIGVVLPLLAIRHMAAAWGWEFGRFAQWELIIILFGHVALICASVGLVRFDPYRLGYRPLPVAVIALAICLYGWWSGNLFLPVLAMIAQLLWVTRQGSSNYFDHILHASLVPIVAIVLVFNAV